ncbi:MAG: hypothetical protein GY938_00140 [Ketobacter sp.]|nr:hypothetical protein [Ketobacter sp.]
MKVFPVLAVLLMLMSGCSGYRMTSNVPPSSKDSAIESYPILVTEGDLEVPYDEIGPLEVIIRPASPFGAAPTERQARFGLMQKARDMGATAVIKVVFKEQFDLISWGHIEARGIAVKEQ